jgi:hypothetical protein
MFFYVYAGFFKGDEMKKIMVALCVTGAMGLSMVAQADEAFVDVGGFRAMLSDSNSGGVISNLEQVHQSTKHVSVDFVDVGGFAAMLTDSK